MKELAYTILRFIAAPILCLAAGLVCLLLSVVTTALIVAVVLIVGLACAALSILLPLPLLAIAWVRILGKGDDWYKNTTKGDE